MRHSCTRFLPFKGEVRYLCQLSQRPLSQRRYREPCTRESHTRATYQRMWPHSRSLGRAWPRAGLPLRLIGAPRCARSVRCSKRSRPKGQGSGKHTRRRSRLVSRSRRHGGSPRAGKSIQKVSPRWTALGSGSQSVLKNELPQVCRR